MGGKELFLLFIRCTAIVVIVDLILWAGDCDSAR